MVEIKSGINWTKNKKVYTIIDVDQDMVQYVVNKPGKSAKIKVKHIDKVRKMIASVENIFNQDTKSKNVKVRGVLISARKLTLRDLPLKKPLANGQETIYCFSLNGKREEFLIGGSTQDTNPVWIPIDDIFKIISEDFLMSISEGQFDMDGDISTKEMKKQALLEIQKLRNK